MIHLPHFDALKRRLGLQTSAKEARIALSYNDFLATLRLFLAAVPVDEEWYLTTYEDVQKAVSAGHVASAKDHFVHDGYFEGRLPAPIEVNEDWYLKQYPDVQEGIRRGEFESAQTHFVSDGYREGRRPFP